MRKFFSWMLTLLALTTAFVGLAMCVLLPFEAARNRNLEAEVAQVAVYRDKMGHIPQRYIYGPQNDGLAIWSDPLDGCSSAFVPPRSDRFVLGFWQGDWWHCYAYPSRKTTLQISVTNYLTSKAGLLIFLNAVVTVVALWAAALLKGRGTDRREMGIVGKTAWFGVWMVFINLFYVAQDSTDDQFIYYAPDHLKWFTQVFDATIYAFEGYFLANPLNQIVNYFNGRDLVWLEISIGFLFWVALAYTVRKLAKFSISYLRARLGIKPQTGG